MDAVMACESFIQDCDELYANYLITSMFATEGNGMDNIKQMARKAWDAIKSLAKRIANAIVDAALNLGLFLLKAKKTKKSAPSTGCIFVPFEEDMQEWEDMIREMNDSGRVEDALKNAEEQTKRVYKFAGKFEIIRSIRDIEEEFADILGNIDDTDYDFLLKGNEAWTLGMEASNQGSRKIFIGKLHDHLIAQSDKCHTVMDHISNTMRDIQNKINQASSDESAEGIKKQKLFGRILKAISKIGSFVNSIASKTKAKFSKFMSLIRRSKPEPN